MKQEVAGAEAGEMSWGYIREILKPYPVWGF